MNSRTWTRRRFVRTAGLAGLAPWVTPLLAAGADDWSSEFARALDANPALLGWRGVDVDRLECTARIEGRLPPQLQGTFYRNGPAVHERFGVRYQHLFDGDGMVQAFRFDGSGITHRAHVLATPKLVRETEAGRRLFSGFATPVEEAMPLRRADDINTANISVLDHHGELLALWEGGSASVLDRETLQWSGFKVWGEGLEDLPFTAHPKVEADGTLWAFGYQRPPSQDPRGKLSMAWRWAASWASTGPRLITPNVSCLNTTAPSATLTIAVHSSATADRLGLYAPSLTSRSRRNAASLVRRASSSRTQRSAASVSELGIARAGVRASPKSISIS